MHMARSKQLTATEGGHSATLPSFFLDGLLGRIFLAPYSPEDSPEVWINIGWFGKEDNEEVGSGVGQVYPEHFAPPFEPVCNMTQWEELFRAIKTYMAEEPLPEPGTCEFLNETGHCD